MAQNVPDEQHHSTRRPGRAQDLFEIVSGALGPVPACKLDVRPFTIFIGAQGSGKSLVAQVLFALEELPFLLYAASLERGVSKKSDRDIFRWVLDHVRSADRAFATFANPNAKIRWTRAQGGEWPLAAPKSFEFSMYQSTRQVLLLKDAQRFVNSLRKRIASEPESLLHHAIYFPTERAFVAGRRSLLAGKAFPQPSTYDLFEHWINDHIAPEVAQWRGGVPPNAEAKRIDALGVEALKGHARKFGERWKWEFGRGQYRQQFDLDMASSGQRSNFSIPYVAKALFALRDEGAIGDELTLLIEEPEISLHPSAQWSMVKILALLVNKGFRVVVTTHSLTLLYAVNNLLQASRVTSESASIPDRDFRLHERDVAVYGFRAGAKPRPLLDRKQAFIDETELGKVGEDLAAELSRVGALLPVEKGDA